MADEIEYSYPVEELDRILLDMRKGIKPAMLPERMKLELALRERELLDQIDEDDDSMQSLLDVHEKMKKEIESKRRKATRTEAPFRPLSEEQSKLLRESMETSIVRKIPGSFYHKTDEELYANEQQREIFQRLGRIRNMYFDAMSFRYAIQTIREAIEFSLRHDYPWLTYEQAVAKFNAGEIRYQFGQIPKLNLGFNKQITDPQILAGIVSGDVQVVDLNKSKPKPDKKKRKDYTPANYDYEVISSQEVSDAIRLHNRGFDTPLGVLLKSKSGLFDRLSLPFQFSEQKQDDQLMQFNWEREGAGEEYYRRKNGIPLTSIGTLYEQINQANGGSINPVLQTNMTAFASQFRYGEQQQSSFDSYLRSSSSPIQPTDRAKEIEAGIMAALRNMNMQNL